MASFADYARSPRNTQMRNLYINCSFTKLLQFVEKNYKTDGSNNFNQQALAIQDLDKSIEDHLAESSSDCKKDALMLSIVSTLQQSEGAFIIASDPVKSSPNSAKNFFYYHSSAQQSPDDTEAHRMTDDNDSSFKTWHVGEDKDHWCTFVEHKALETMYGGECTVKGEKFNVSPFTFIVVKFINKFRRIQIFQTLN